MELSKEVLELCRQLVNSEDDHTTDALNGCEVIRVAGSDVFDASSKQLRRAVEPVAKNDSAFCSVSVVWGRYLFQELPSDSDLFFVIRENEC